MASFAGPPADVYEERPKKKRKRVSAKFRRLTKERRQANARERDRANALRTAFLSLEGSLPCELKEQLPTRFGTMLAAILYIGHLNELVCGRESPSLEVVNRAACRRYQGLTGEEENNDGDNEQDADQVELRLATDSLLTSSLLVSSSRSVSEKSSPATPSSSCESVASSDSGCDQSCDRLQPLSSSSSASSSCSSESPLTLSPLDDFEKLLYPSIDFFDDNLFPIPDLGADDLFANLI